MTLQRRRSWFRRKKMNPAVRHLDDLCREIVFYRDGYKCWDCGAEITEVRFRKDDGWPWYPSFQWAHIFGRARGAMKWDPLNTITSCARCHELFHDNRFAAPKLAKFQTLFPERWADLERLAAAPAKRVDKAAIGEELAHEFNSIRKQTLAYSVAGSMAYHRGAAA